MSDLTVQMVRSLRNYMKVSVPYTQPDGKVYVKLTFDDDAARESFIASLSEAVDAETREAEK